MIDQIALAKIVSQEIIFNLFDFLSRTLGIESETINSIRGEVSKFSIAFPERTPSSPSEPEARRWTVPEEDADKTPITPP